MSPSLRTLAVLFLNIIGGKPPGEVADLWDKVFHRWTFLRDQSASAVDLIAQLTEGESPNLLVVSNLEEILARAGHTTTTLAGLLDIDEVFLFENSPRGAVIRAERNLTHLIKTLEYLRREERAASIAPVCPEQRIRWDRYRRLQMTIEELEGALDLPVRELRQDPDQ